MVNLSQEEQEFLNATIQQNRKNLNELISKTVTAIDYHPTDGLYLETLSITFDDGTILSITEQGQAGWFSANAQKLRQPT